MMAAASLVVGIIIIKKIKSASLAQISRKF